MDAISLQSLVIIANNEGGEKTYARVVREEPPGYFVNFGNGSFQHVRRGDVRPADFLEELQKVSRLLDTHGWKEDTGAQARVLQQLHALVDDA